MTSAGKIGTIAAALTALLTGGIGCGDSGPGPHLDVTSGVGEAVHDDSAPAWDGQLVHAEAAPVESDLPATALGALSCDKLCNIVRGLGCEWDECRSECPESSSTACGRMSLSYAWCMVQAPGARCVDGELLIDDEGVCGGERAALLSACESSQPESLEEEDR